MRRDTVGRVLDLVDDKKDLLETLMWNQRKVEDYKKEVCKLEHQLVTAKQNTSHLETVLAEANERMSKLSKANEELIRQRRICTCAFPSERDTTNGHA